MMDIFYHMDDRPSAAKWVPLYWIQMAWQVAWMYKENVEDHQGGKRNIKKKGRV